MNFESESEVQAHLAMLHEAQGLKWREIGLLPEFYGWISFASLYKIWKTGVITNPEFRIRFGLPPNETCGMCHVFDKYKPRVRKPRQRWSDYPIKVVLNSLINREEL